MSVAIERHYRGGCVGEHGILAPEHNFRRGFAADLDPNSIQGVPGAGAAGSVSGYELVGATVTIVDGYSDGLAGFA